jgi:tetratricopeptide (TPR) repeat protein
MHRIQAHKRQAIVSVSAIFICLSCSLLAAPEALATPATDAYNRGLLYRRQKKSGDALRQFDLAIKLDPKYIEAYMQRIDCFTSIDQAAKTLADCNKVVALDPSGKQQPLIFVYRGMAYKQLDMPEEALADANKAYDLGIRNHRDVYYLRGFGHRNTGQFKEAVQDYTTLLEKFPGRNDYYDLEARAQLYQALDQPEKALADLTEAISRSPKFDEAYEDRAHLYEKIGKPEKALEDYSSLIKMNPGDYTNYFARGKLLLKMKRYAEAVADLSKSIEIEPQMSSKFYESRAEAYSKLGKNDLAAKDRATATQLKNR